MPRPRSRPRQAPKHYPRVARVNEVVLAALAEELADLSDPRLGFVTLTGVEVSTDLQVADVYYSVLGTAEERVETAAALASAGPRLRSVLGRHVRMKYLPELRFREDPSVAGGQRIDSILRDLHAGDLHAGDLHVGGDAADDAGDRPGNEGE